MQPHARQHFLDLVQGFAAKVRGAQHFGFGLLDQIANINDIVVLQTVCRPHGKLQLVHFLKQQRVEFQTVIIVLTICAFRFVKVDKDRQLILKDTCGKCHRVIRGQRSVGFHLHRQFVVIQNLTFAGRLHVIRHFLDRRIDRVDRDKANWRIFWLVLVSRDITFAGVDGQFHEHVRTFVEVTDDVILVQNFDTGGFRNISGGDNTWPLGIDRQAFWPFDFHADRHALKVQNDVGDIFANPGNGRKFVQYVVNLYACDGRALKRAHQNAAQRVAQRQTKAAFQRFGNDGGLFLRVVARLHVKLSRLDKFCPVFVDHACLLNSCCGSMSLNRNARG